MANQYVIWLGQDHPEILIKIGRHKYERPMKALHPSTIRNYVGHLKDYLEEVGGFEISDRRWKKRIKLPKTISEDPEPFKPEEVRILLDNSSPKKKFLYMVLKAYGEKLGYGIDAEPEQKRYSRLLFVTAYFKILFEYILNKTPTEIIQEPEMLDTIFKTMKLIKDC